MVADLAGLGARCCCFVEDSLMVESGRQGVLIVGCGRSGLAAARLHLRRGDPRPLWVYDDNEQAQALLLTMASQFGMAMRLTSLLRCGVLAFR